MRAPRRLLAVAVELEQSSLHPGAHRGGGRLARRVKLVAKHPEDERGVRSQGANRVSYVFQVCVRYRVSE